MNDKPLISIIIPIYNVERYLEQCLYSIVTQTYKHIEIICVNDASEDNSLQILKDYQSKDSRIIVIDKINEGVSKARNIGLLQATGELIMFVDSDDWLDCCVCEKVVATMKEYDPDVVLWPYISESEHRSTPKIIFSEKYILEENEVKDKIHRRFVGLVGEELSKPEQADSLCTVWGKAYKRKLILEHNVQFIDLDIIGTYEDGMFNLEVFNYVKKVVYLPDCFYHYRRENTFSITSRYRERLFEQWQNLFQQMQDYIKKNQLSNDYEIALYNRIALSILGLGLNIISSNYTVLKKIGMIREILSNERYREAYKKLEYKYFPIHWKIFYKCAKWRWAFGEYILLVIIKKIISR